MPEAEEEAEDEAAASASAKALKGSFDEVLTGAEEPPSPTPNQTNVLLHL